MKVVIDQKTLLKGLERGAMAALSDDAQKDSTGFSSVIKSVRITVGDELVIESGTSLMSSRWTLPANKDNGIVVKEKGTIFIPAKDLYNWVSKQSKANIQLQLKTLATPELISTGEGEQDYGSGQSITVKKVGNVKLVSVDESKTGNQWALECYDDSQLSFVDFSKKPKAVFSLPVKQLDNALKNVAFSALVPDMDHIFDTVAVESHKGKMYMFSTDTHRVSTYCLDQVDDVDNDFFVETTSGDMGQKLLINVLSLKAISKLSNGPKVEIGYDSKKGKIFISQDGWEVRIATIDGQNFKSIPSIAYVFQKKYDELASVPKNVLASRLVSASLVNKATVLFDFKGTNLVIQSLSESGKSPNISNAPARNVTKEVKAVWGVQHILDILRVIKDEDVKFSVPSDLLALRITSNEDPNLAYYSMTIDSKLYASFFTKVEEEELVAQD